MTTVTERQIDRAVFESLLLEYQKPLFRVLMTGGRDFMDKDKVYQTLDAIVPRPDVLIHGAARGADTLAKQWAQDRGVKLDEYPVTSKDLSLIHI